MSSWIVTRERSDGEPLVEELRARGLRARALPCIERTALPWPEQLAPASTPGAPSMAPTVVLCTSPFAAALVVARWPTLRSQAGAALLSCAATAPVTARLLADAGVPVSISAPGGVVGVAQALVKAIGDGPRPRVLYPTSDLGDESHEHAEALAALASRAEVVSGVIYTTSPAPGLEHIVRELEPDAALLCFSPSAIKALVAAAERAGVSLPAVVVCVGDSTARALSARAGRAGILVPRGMSVADFVATQMEAPR